MYRIKSKLIATFISFIFLLLLISGIFLWIHFKTVKQYQDMSKTIILAQKIPQLTSNFIEAYYSLVKNMDAPAKQTLYNELHREIIANINSLDNFIQHKQSVALYPGIKKLVLNIIKRCDEEIKSISAGNLMRALATYHEVIKHNYYVRENIASLILIEAEIAEKSHKRIQEQHRRSIQMGFISLSIITIAGVLFAIIFSDKMTQPLTKLSLLSRSIADGHMDVSVPQTLIRRRDEIGVLSNSFHTMINHLQKTIGQLHQANKDLVNAQNELKETNLALQLNLEKLNITKNKLVESEKMAALGGLVAGVAHEINTPLGTALTSNSFLEDTSHKCYLQFTQGTLKRSELESYFKKTLRLTSILDTNLNQAAELVNHFKQVAVDQSENSRRSFNIKKSCQKVLLGLPLQLKKDHTIFLNCPDNIEINSYPGLFNQILTNLIKNSLMHGFQEIDKGVIEINIRLSNNTLVISFDDNGSGMSTEVLKKCLNPFFTTKRNQGGTGLGLNIVFNIVVHALKGEVDFTSTLGNGVFYLIRIPFH